MSDLHTIKNIIVTGDLNLHLGKVTGKETMKFNRILLSCGMKHNINEPTQVRGHMVDVVTLQSQNNVTVLAMLDLSTAFYTIDHNTLLQRLEHLFGFKK